MRHSLRTGLCAAACFGLLSPGAAQEAPPSVFGELVDVRVVNIEVVVTNRDGERVYGLGADAFRLTVDGKEQEITNFSEVREAAVQPGAIAGGQSAVPEERESVPTRYLLFIDDLFSIAAQRNLVLAKLKDQVLALGTGDTMAVVAFNGRKLEVLSNWTGDQAALREVLTKAAARRAYGAFRRAEKASVSDGAGPPVDTSLPPWVVQNDANSLEKRSFAERLVALLKNEVAAARGALRSFGGASGRKVLLLLAGGWPFSPPELTAGTALTFPDRRLREGADLYAPLVETANLVGFTIYPVDVPGLGDSQGFADESNLDASLRYLAEETGGKAFVNGLQNTALERAATDTRSYYWLGFSPTRKADDRAHKIRVEMRTRGLEARFRQSFSDLSRSAEMTMRVESALLAGSSAGGKPLPVQLGTVKALRGGTMEVPLVVGIPVGEVTILEHGGKFVAELELRIGVLDERATMAPVDMVPVRLASEAKPQVGKLVRYPTKLTLRDEPHDLVISLFDPASGNLLSTYLKVEAATTKKAK